MTSASWTLIGMLLVVIVNVKPAAWPPSASLALARPGSRLIGGIVLSYAQLVGGIGPLAGTPTFSHTPLTICSRSSEEATAWRRALVANGGRVWFSWYAKSASEGTSTTTTLRAALTAATSRGCT